MRVAIIGCGTVGSRASRQLLTVPGVTSLLLADTDPAIAHRLQSVIGSRSKVVSVDEAMTTGPEVVLLSRPFGHVEIAEQLVVSGSHVVSCSDDIDDVEGLLGLDDLATREGRFVVVGAGFMPGLTDVLAVHAGAEFDVVDEVHVAKLGTAGPACARQHHGALSREAVDWRDGEWIRRPGGSGRELVWFPDPIGGADCYRASLPDSRLLHEVLPTASRVTARMAATRRDRVTSWLPMLRPPHREAGPGAVRVEVRGRRDGVAGSVIFGCMDRPSVAAGAVAALAIAEVLTGRASQSGRTAGAFGMGSLVRAVDFLGELSRRGVRCARFEGARDR
jgi:saccharopine dehydrogenase-like NADP-dependent oxidoreductase